MIRIQGLTKKFGDFVAVDNLDLEIANGAIYGLLGPNGAGKSTTLKMMTGILLPDGGKVYYDDVSLLDDPEKAKAKIGFVPDSPDMFLGMKGRDYLAFIASIFKVDREKALERAKTLSKTLGIAKNLDEYIVTYSHGMRQKIFLLGALLHEPDAFILDEPLTGLDPESAYVIKNMMMEHVMKGKTVLISTHVLDVAEKLCTHIGIIDKGKLLFSGTLAELRRMRQEENSSLETLFLELTRK